MTDPYLEAAADLVVFAITFGIVAAYWLAIEAAVRFFKTKK